MAETKNTEKQNIEIQKEKEICPESRCGGEIHA